MKKVIYLGTFVLFTVALSACDATLHTTVHDDGTGVFSFGGTGDTAEVAEMLEITEEQVVPMIELSVTSMEKEGEIPEGFSFEVDNADGKLYMDMRADFTYDETGWVVGDGSGGLNNQPGVVSDSSNNTVTFSQDVSLLNMDSVLNDETITSFNVAVTFPGEVLEVSGGGNIDGTTVVWDRERIQESLDTGIPLSAVGSLESSIVETPSEGDDSTTPSSDYGDFSDLLGEGNDDAKPEGEGTDDPAIMIAGGGILLGVVLVAVGAIRNRSSH